MSNQASFLPVRSKRFALIVQEAETEIVKLERDLYSSLSHLNLIKKALQNSNDNQLQGHLIAAEHRLVNISNLIDMYKFTTWIDDHCKVPPYQENIQRDILDNCVSENPGKAYSLAKRLEKVIAEDKIRDFLQRDSPMCGGQAPIKFLRDGKILTVVELLEKLLRYAGSAELVNSGLVKEEELWKDPSLRTEQR